MIKYCIFQAKPTDKNGIHKVVFSTTNKLVCGMKLKSLKLKENAREGRYYVAKVH